MSGGRHRVLHIGGDAADARIIREALAESTRERYEVAWAATLADALEQLTTIRMNAVLLNLQVPDAPGINGLEQLRRAAPAVPILVVGTDENEEIARQVIRAG